MLGEDFSGRLCFSGLVPGDGRTLYAPIEFHLLKDVISIEQCAALIAYYLRHYPIARSPAWLIEGQRDLDLLPWNLDAARRKAAYDAQPKCFVRRDWLRLALNSLSAMIAAKSHDTIVRFAFADDVLSVECGAERFVVSASGLPWPRPIALRASDLSALPKRLKGDEICILVGDTYLGIGTKYYDRLIDEGVNQGTG